jgi:hypothetical protein
MKTHKIYLLLEIDTYEPEVAVGLYPHIGGHALVNRLRDCTANGHGMLERLMIKCLASQKCDEQVVHYQGGEMAGSIKIVRVDQMIVDT